MQKQKENLSLQKWVATISTVLLIVKFLAYYLTNSVAILSDALESIINVVAGFIGLYSLYIAAKPSDSDHPYGHGKAEFISASIEGTMIAIAGVLIIYKAIKNIFFPVEIKELDYGLILIAATALANYLLGYYCVSKGKKNNSLALVASGKHLQSDTYSTAAIVVGVGCLMIFKYAWIDSAVASLSGAYIMITGYKILRRSLGGIMDEADEQLLTQVINLLQKNRMATWIDLHNLRIIKFGSVMHIDCHLTVPWYYNVIESHKEIDAVANLIKNEFGDSVEFFVHADACEPDSCQLCNVENCAHRKSAFIKQIVWSNANVLKNERHTME